MTGRGAVVSGGKCCPLLLLTRFLLQVSLSAASGLGKSASVAFEPSTMHGLVEGSNQTVVMSVSVPREDFDRQPPGEWVVGLKSYHDDIAQGEEPMVINKESFTLDNSSRFYTLDTTIMVTGHTLGKTGLRLRLVTAEEWDDGDDWWKSENPDSTVPPRDDRVLDVWVRRSEESEKLTKIFVASVVILITLANIMMGCELDLTTVMDTLKRPVGPVIGFFAQFLIMPLLAYGIAQTVFVSRGLYPMALGLFITGCSPGGGASNFWTLLLDGNVNLSITMTFISTLASLVMMPMWLSLLGVHFMQGFSTNTHIAVPYANITRSLASLVIPLLIGVAIQKWLPSWAEKSRKIMRPFIIFVLVFVILFGSISNFYMFRLLTWPALLGGLLLPWCGFMFGCFTSIVFRRTPADVTAIAIETGIQNTGIAILMLKASFSQPDADIGAVLPILVACFTPAPLLLGAAVHLSLKAIKKRRQSSVDSSTKCPSGISLELAMDTPQISLLVDPKKRLDSEEPAAYSLEA